MKEDGPDYPCHADGTEADERDKQLPKRRRLDGAGEVDGAVGAASVDSAKSLPVRTRFLRILVNKTRSPRSTSMQLGEVGLRCRGETLQISSFTAASMYGASPLSEGPEKVLRPTGKFLDFNFRSHERSLLVLSATAEFDVDEFALRTASDSPSRDPVNLTVEGSVDNREWQLLLNTNPAGLATPTERRAWTPWLPLRALGPAPPLPPPPNVGSGARFFCCPLPGCQNFEAKVEGYLWEGKLLNHMLREHPRSAKTRELSTRLHGCKASISSVRSPSIKESPTDAVLAASTNTSAVSIRQRHAGEIVAAAASMASMSATPVCSSIRDVITLPEKSSVAEGFSSVPPPAATAITEATSTDARAATNLLPSLTPSVPPVTPQVRHDSNLDDSPQQSTPLPPSPLVTRRRLDQQQPWKEHQKEEQIPEEQQVEQQQPEEQQRQQKQEQQQHGLSPHSAEVSDSINGSEDNGCPASHAADEADLGLLSSTSEVIEALPKLHPHCSSSSTISSRSRSNDIDVAIPISGLDLLQRYPPIEATVEERLDINPGTGFDILLRDNSGSAWAAFRGEAVTVFGESAALRRGNCVRLEGYDLMPLANNINAEAGRRYNLLVSTVHAAIRITTLKSSLVSLEMLRDVAPGELVSVEADVSYFGPLRMGGPPGLQPAGAPSRALLLRDGTAACALVLHSRDAEDCSSDLLGCRVRVYGTRLTDFKGKRHLSGWEHVELLQAKTHQQ